MKKLIIAASMVLSFFAHSEENWTLVSTSVDLTNKLMVDSGTFGVVRDHLNPVSPRYLVAKFKIIGRNDIGVRIYLVKAADCNKGKGELWQRQHKGYGWVTTENYIWTLTGDQFSDQAGQTLCSILGVRLRELERANAAPPTLGNIFKSCYDIQIHHNTRST